MKNGYCFHSHVIFPIWHRPYVFLFEVSTISNKMEKVLTDDTASRVRYHGQ